MSDHSETQGPRPYVVGYCNPPVQTRFQKGRSGNPAGKRKGTKNFSTALKEALQEPVVIRENGKRKTISKQDVIAKQLTNRAASGELRAISLVAALKSNIDVNPEVAIETSTLSEQDKKLIRSLLKCFGPDTNDDENE